jgi:hypothetical protein
MTSKDPPERGEGRHQGRPSSTTFTTSDHHDADQDHGKAYVRQLCARRAASYRVAVLGSGRSDPWWYEPPGARGYPDAAMHLLGSGLMPAPDREGLQVMKRHCGACRKAAEDIAKTWGLAA